MKIGFIGLGNMATAMIGGIIESGLCESTDIIGNDNSEESKRRAYENLSITCVKDNITVAQQADILVLSVKPQVYPTVISEIKGTVTENQIVISIAPGKTLLFLESSFGKDLKIVRCMPNTPALVKEGCTGVCKNKNVTDEEFDTVIKLLNGFGKAYPVSEHQMDAVVAVSGSSPAYVFMMIEAMADAAVAEGLARNQAYEFAAQAVLGSAKMVLEMGKHPGELKDMVCSPAGTTIEAVRVLEDKGFRSAIIEAMKVCADKSRSL